MKAVRVYVSKDPDTDEIFCPVCWTNNIIVNLRYMYISLEEAIFKCPTSNCFYPFRNFIFKNFKTQLIYFYEPLPEDKPSSKTEDVELINSFDFSFFNEPLEVQLSPIKAINERKQDSPVKSETKCDVDEEDYLFEDESFTHLMDHVEKSLLSEQSYDLNLTEIIHDICIINEVRPPEIQVVAKALTLTEVKQPITSNKIVNKLDLALIEKRLREKLNAKYGKKLNIAAKTYFSDPGVSGNSDQQTFKKPKSPMKCSRKSKHKVDVSIVQRKKSMNDELLHIYDLEPTDFVDSLQSLNLVSEEVFEKLNEAVLINEKRSAQDIIEKTKSQRIVTPTILIASKPTNKAKSQKKIHGDIVMSNNQLKQLGNLRPIKINSPYENNTEDGTLKIKEEFGTTKAQQKKPIKPKATRKVNKVLIKESNPNSFKSLETQKNKKSVQKNILLKSVKNSEEPHVMIS